MEERAPGLFLSLGAEERSEASNSISNRRNFSRRKRRREEILLPQRLPSFLPGFMALLEAPFLSQPPRWHQVFRNKVFFAGSSFIAPDHLIRGISLLLFFLFYLSPRRRSLLTPDSQTALKNREGWRTLPTLRKRTKGKSGGK